MVQDELDLRRSRLTLADFDWRFNPKLPRAACFVLHTLKFVTEGANALVLGVNHPYWTVTPMSAFGQRCPSSY